MLSPLAAAASTAGGGHCLRRSPAVNSKGVVSYMVTYIFIVVFQEEEEYGF